MHTRILSLIILFSFIGAPLHVALAVNPADLQKSIQEKTQELQEVNKKIEETQTVLNTVEAKGKTLQQEIKRIDSTLQQVDLGIKASTINIQKLSYEIESLQADIALKEEQIVDKRVTISSLIQDYQIKDTEGLLLVMLKHKSLSDSLNETQSIINLNDSLLTDLETIRQLKSQLSDRLTQVTGKQQEVKQEQSNLKVRKSIAEDQKDERAELLKETKNQEKAYQAVLSELEKQQQAISEEIDVIEDKLRAAFDNSVLPTKRTGVLSWPTKEPYVTQEYGYTAFAARAYKSKFHNGLDLRARPVGQPIYAADDGKVIATGDNGKVQYGRYIVIEHENNLTTLYAHLSRFAVSSGSTVKRGELIGYSGNTGYSFSPHLHFVVYWGPSVKMQSFPGAGLVPVGTTVDPRDYL